jgi:hypothetical protein
LAANFTLGCDPIPRNPRLSMHDRNPAPGNAIEQRRFSNVRPSYDRDIHRKT